MVDKRKIRRLARLKLQQAFPQGYQNPASGDGHVVIKGDYWKNSTEKRTRYRRRAKEGHTQAANSGAGIIPRGSELAMNLQSVLGYTDEARQGFMGQPAPPDDSHPTVEDTTYYRRARRNRRKYIGQAPNSAFIGGEWGADVSDGVIEGKLEEVIKRMLVPIAIDKLRNRARRSTNMTRVMRSRAMKGVKRGSDELAEEIQAYAERAYPDVIVEFERGDAFIFYITEEINSHVWARRMSSVIQALQDVYGNENVEELTTTYSIPSDRFLENKEYYIQLQDDSKGTLEFPHYTVDGEYPIFTRLLVIDPTREKRARRKAEAGGLGGVMFTQVYEIADQYTHFPGFGDFLVDAFRSEAWREMGYTHISELAMPLEGLIGGLETVYRSYANDPHEAVEVYLEYHYQPTHVPQRG